MDKSIFPYIAQSLMGRYGPNSADAVFGEEVTGLQDKTAVDIASEIEKDARFRSPLEDLGKIGSSVDTSVFAGVGEGSREKGMMYNAIAGLLSGVASGAGEDFTTQSKNDAKNKVLEALTSRDSSLLGSDSRLDPYKSKVDLFGERIGGLEAKRDARRGLEDKGLQSVLAWQRERENMPQTLTPYQKISSELNKNKFKLDKEKFELDKEERKLKRGGNPILEQMGVNPNTLKKGENGEVTGVTDTGERVAIDSAVADRLGLVFDPNGDALNPALIPYTTYQGFTTPDGEVIPSRFDSILKLNGVLPPNPEAAREVVQIAERQNKAIEDRAAKIYPKVVEGLRGSDIAKNPNAAQAFGKLQELRKALEAEKASDPLGGETVLGNMSNTKGSLLNYFGIGSNDSDAKITGLKKSLEQFWTGASRVVGSGSQSDIEFKAAVESFQSPNLSINNRLNEIDKIIDVIDRNQKVLRTLESSVQTVGYNNGLAYAASQYSKPLGKTPLQEDGTIPPIAPTPPPGGEVPTPPPGGAGGGVPTYQQYRSKFTGGGR